MFANCPTCGNEISFSLKYEDGVCRYCRRWFDIKVSKNGKKKHINLVEKVEKNTKKYVQNDKNSI